MTVKAVWHIVKESAKSIGVAKLAPHDLRRYARLCHASGDELEQIQFLFGARFGADYRTQPWLQATNSIGRQ
jgi:site-specific recombinase XerD